MVTYIEFGKKLIQKPISEFLDNINNLIPFKTKDDYYCILINYFNASPYIHTRIGSLNENYYGIPINFKDLVTRMNDMSESRYNYVYVIKLNEQEFATVRLAPDYCLGPNACKEEQDWLISTFDDNKIFPNMTLAVKSILKESEKTNV